MEKVCEFCTAFRPVVYCKADAANLCLSCDAKVHSANALSNRHLRTLLCNSCRHRPCSVRCLDHSMFICHGCDSNLHGVSSQHQRRVVSCYTGCPSAKDFAVMWGFQVNNDAALEPSFSLVKSTLRRKMLPSCDELTAGSSGRQSKSKFQRDNGFILQQILELEKLELDEGNGGLLLTEQADASTLVSNISEDLDKKSTRVPQQSEEQLSDPLQTEKELMVEFSSSPFPEMEHLSSCSTVGHSLWQCKSPSKNNQFWYQNLQDIGVCEDTLGRDDIDIPDVDLTFRNFEELFGADQEPVAELLDNNVTSLSSLESGTSVCKSHDCNARTREATSTASSFNSDPSAQTKRDPSQLNGSRESMENRKASPPAVRPVCSSLSFTMSRLSGETHGTDCHDSQLSPAAGEEVSCWSPRSDNVHLGGRENAVSRLKEKKKARFEEKQARYVPRKARKEARKGVNGRFAVAEGCSSDTVGMTRSY